MDNRELADEMIKRLNDLVVGNPEVAYSITQLIETKVNVPETVADHPTIQVTQLNDGLDDFFQVGFLGVLNGLVGVIEDGPKKDWGFITAVYDEGGTLLRFERTNER